MGISPRNDLKCELFNKADGVMSLARLKSAFSRLGWLPSSLVSATAF